MRDIPRIWSSILIKLAAPEQIKAWSYGESQEARDHQLPDPPSRSGKVCSANASSAPPRNGSATAASSSPSATRVWCATAAAVEVTHFNVLAASAWATSSWRARSATSGTTARSRQRAAWVCSSTFLIAALRSITDYEKYIVTDPGDTDLKKNQLLTEEEYMELSGAARR